MRKNRSVRSIVLDFVSANGPQTWKTLHEVVLTVQGRSLNDRNYGSSYLDQVSSGSVCVPTRHDTRHLVKNETDGKYYLMNE